MVNAYYVRALWGSSREDGDYATYIWAEDEAAAARECVVEMNSHRVPPVDPGSEDWRDFEVVNVRPLEDYVEQEEGALSLAREFLRKGPHT